jgi:S1-C subfamily serine protease
MLRPSPYRPDTEPSATRLAIAVALVLAGGVVATGLVWLRMGQSGRGSAGPRSAPAGVAVAESDRDADVGSERSSSAVDPVRGRSPRGDRAAGRGGAEGLAADGDGDGRNGGSSESSVDELLAAWDRLERRIAAAMARARESVVALEYTAADAPADTRRVATGVVVNNGGEILSVRIDPPPTRPAPGTGKNLAPIVARDFLGRRHVAQWVAADPDTGLTLLRVSPRAVRPIRSAADGPKLGSQVFVVGSPFGMGHSVSRGHVAGLDRALELGTGQLGGLIQVQAPLYPGDSGAAVVDLRGHWLGLIRGGLAVPGSGSATDSDPAATAGPPSPVARADAAEPDDDPATAASGRSEPDTDFGFAIPTRDVLWIASQLRTYGYVDRAYLGVRLAVTPTTAAAGPIASSEPTSPAPSPPAAGWKTGATDVPTGVAPASATMGPGDADRAPASTTAGDGARVSDVLAGTPAALAGLRSGDRIVALDGQPIHSHHDLIDRLDRIPARMTIMLGVVRGEDPRRPPINLPLLTASRPGSLPVSPSSTAPPSEAAGARANVPVTPTASQSAPPTPPPAPSPAAPVPTSPALSPARDAAPGSGVARSPRPADPDRTTPDPTPDRAKPLTPPPTSSFNELRLTLPRAFIERIEQLERRLEKLETFSPPAAPGPGAAPRRPVDSVRIP